MPAHVAFPALPPDAASLAAAAVRGAWESLLLAPFLSLLLRWMPGLSPRASFRVWAAGFALAAALPLCRLSPGAHVAFVPGNGGMAVSRALPVLELAPVWAWSVCGVWLLASLIALLRLAAGVWALHRLLRSTQPAPPAVQAIFASIVAERHGGGKRLSRARLLVADEVAAPSACGVFGPCILLPRGLAAQFSPEEIECVLRHEAAHLRRRDDWLAVLTRLVQAALPFAVAIGYLERRMAAAREMACDDAALRSHLSRRRYASCLARLAECARTPGWAALAPGLGGQRSQLAARVGYILAAAQPVRGPGKMRLACAFCAATLLGAALVAAPTLLTFSGDQEFAAAATPQLATALASAPSALLRSPVPAAAALHAASLRVPAAHRPQRFLRAFGKHGGAVALPATYRATQTVFVVWAEREDGGEGRFLLLVARPQPGPGWSDVVLLTI